MGIISGKFVKRFLISFVMLVFAQELSSGLYSNTLRNFKSFTLAPKSNELKDTGFIVNWEEMKGTSFEVAFDLVKNEEQFPFSNEAKLFPSFNDYLHEVTNVHNIIWSEINHNDYLVFTPEEFKRLIDSSLVYAFKIRNKNNPFKSHIAGILLTYPIRTEGKIAYILKHYRKIWFKMMQGIRYMGKKTPDSVFFWAIGILPNADLKKKEIFGLRAPGMKFAQMASEFLGKKYENLMTFSPIINEKGRENDKKNRGESKGLKKDAKQADLGFDDFKNSLFEQLQNEKLKILLPPHERKRFIEKFALPLYFGSIKSQGIIPVINYIISEENPTIEAFVKKIKDENYRLLNELKEKFGASKLLRPEFLKLKNDFTDIPFSFHIGNGARFKGFLKNSGDRLNGRRDSAPGTSMYAYKGMEEYPGNMERLFQEMVTYIKSRALLGQYNQIPENLLAAA